MGILARLFGREQRADTAAAERSVAMLSADEILLKALGLKDQITADSLMEIPAFSAAINFVSAKVAALPVKLYEDDPDNGETKEITADRRLFLLNDEADSELMNALDAKKAQIRDMLIYGAGYLYIERGNGGFKSLRYVDKRDVSIMRNSDPIFRKCDLYVGGRRYAPYDFLILTRNSSDGVSGKGVLDENRTITSTLLGALNYENGVSATGGNRKGFLQAEHKLGADELKLTRDAWDNLHSKPEYTMMILNNGMKYVPSGSSSVEMQLNQNKLTNSSQIAMLFGLGTAILSGTASTAEIMSAAVTAIQPVVETYQAALNRSLLLESEKGRKYFVLDMSELLKGDMLSRYQAYAVGLQNNFLQPDEVRYKEDMPPLGFNYIKLGLNDVLLDPNTGVIYTPNTNKTVKMGDTVSEVEQISDEGLQNPDDGGIIEETRAKTNWKKGKDGRFTGSVSNGRGGRARITKKEYERLCHEICTDHPSYKDGSIHCCYNRDHFYIFSVVEPGTYSFSHKIHRRYYNRIKAFEEAYDE
ncbi:MAG: phage portal protein [Ruminococcaceae bacterium]|nr:phage portal protein [Oscillospiraceae bacterium]